MTPHHDDPWAFQARMTADEALAPARRSAARYEARCNAENGAEDELERLRRLPDTAPKTRPWAFDTEAATQADTAPKHPDAGHLVPRARVRLSGALSVPTDTEATIFEATHDRAGTLLLVITDDGRVLTIDAAKVTPISRPLTAHEQADYDDAVAEAAVHEANRLAEIARRPDCPNCGRPGMPRVCPACGTERIER